VLKVVLSYHSGTILIRGIAHIPFATIDPRTNLLRAAALHYTDILDYLKQSGIEYVDNILDPIPSPHMNLDDSNHNNNDNNTNNNNNNYAFLPLRDYQQMAIDNWIKATMRGCIVLPTGSGKTILGIKAIEKVNSASLVIVPTIDLMDQWTSILSKYFKNVKIGKLGGGSDSIESITISTYDSAYLRASSLGNKFSLVIFDEVHHLAAPGYRSIAEQMASPFRLGLTATIEREDGMHTELPKLVGGIVFEISPKELADRKHLALYEIERRQVQMLPEEVAKYKQHYDNYHACLEKLGFRFPLAFEKLVMLSAKNKVAREALLSRNKAIGIALNSKSKIEELREILAENKGVKTIIFTQHNSLVYEISNIFLIPYITYKTSKEERQDVLKGFREGRYNAIVTSKVLDEGVDIPDAELGIILSGTGSAREFIQRLGRLLRPKFDINKKAKLIEIISAETREIETSIKRKKSLHNEGIINNTDIKGKNNIGKQDIADNYIVNSTLPLVVTPISSVDLKEEKTITVVAEK
jgi:superfamily II DNA or RNA helicase